MVTVKILSGAYGYKTQNGRIRPVPFGQCCRVDDEEAMRLVSIGAAEIVGEMPAKEKPADFVEASEPPAANQQPKKKRRKGYSNDSSLKELASLCRKRGIRVPAKATKRVLTELLDNAADEEEAPDLSAEMPV